MGKVKMVRRAGTIRIQAPQPVVTEDICLIDGCDIKVSSRGLCQSHYSVFRFLVRNEGYVPEQIIDMVAEELADNPYASRIKAAVPRGMIP